jgi:hypothetical protein
LKRFVRTCGRRKNIFILFSQQTFDALAVDMCRLGQWDKRRGRVGINIPT